MYCNHHCIYIYIYTPIKVDGVAELNLKSCCVLQLKVLKNSKCSRNSRNPSSLLVCTEVK